MTGAGKRSDAKGTFRYEAIADDGTTLRGSLLAADSASAARDLRQRGLVPTYVGTSDPYWLGHRRRRLPRNRRSAARFTEDLAELLGAGLSLERALSIGAETWDSDREAGMARHLLGALRGGDSLGEAMARRPEYFSRLYVNTVRTGEEAGELPLVMRQLASFERDRERLRSEITSSMAYPALLLVVGVAAMLVILLYVVPRFSESFRMSGFEAPVPMQLLMGASALVSRAWPLLVLGPPAAILVLVVCMSRETVRARADAALLRLPVVGPFLRNAETARFARAMSTLVAASVPLVTALGVARSVVANRVFEQALGVVRRGVRRGEGIARPVAGSGVFPPLAARLLAVGEETGRLDRVFERLAGIYERKTRESLKRFTVLFEPLVILGLGIVVGIMILSILMALTSIQARGL